jgi:hypothetical protein
MAAAMTSEAIGLLHLQPLGHPSSRLSKLSSVDRIATELPPNAAPQLIFL